MAKVLINKEAFSVLKLPFRKKYIFYTSVVFFILLASLYLNTSGIKYKVSSEISLNYPDQSAALVAEDLKSKTLVQKAISQLSFEVNYYKESSPGKEIYRDSLPVRLILNKKAGRTYANNLTIKSLSSHSFSIEHEDTIQFYEINDPVDRYYGKFRVIRGPAFTPHFQTVIVRLNNPFDLVEDYYNNLVSEPDESSKTISLSVLVNNKQKGQDFLYKLVELYSTGHSTSTLNKKTDYNDSIQSLTFKLLDLQARTKKSKVLAGPKLNAQQLNTLKVIKPYLLKPVNQFVQVPYTEEVQHQDLKDDLDVFNKMQLEKQRLLGQTKVDDLEVSNIDKRISVLKASVLKAISRLQNNEAEPNNQLPDNSAARHLQDQILKYQLAQNAEIVNTDNIKIIERPEDNIKKIAPNAFLVYVIALLIGMLVPMLFTLIKTLNTSITQREWFSSQTFGEKIKILFGVRQID